MQSDASLAYTLAFLYTPATSSASASRKADNATTFQNYFLLRIFFNALLRLAASTVLHKVGETVHSYRNSGWRSGQVRGGQS